MNNKAWTENQIYELVNSLNSVDEERNFLIIKLIRNDNFSKILSKCTAITLYDKLQDGAYDIKTEKMDIIINEKLFEEMCKIKFQT